MVFEQATHQLLRERLWNILAHGRGKLGSLYNSLLILVIILSLAILPLEFIQTLERYHSALWFIELFTTVLFTMEYALHIYAAPKRSKYIFSFYGIIDLLSILPFLLGFLGTQYVSALPLFRLIRLGEVENTETNTENVGRGKGMSLAPGETIDYVVTMHPIYLILGCMPPVLSTSVAIGMLLFFNGHPAVISLSACLFLFAIIFVWKTWLDYRYDVIYVTSQRLIWQNQYLLGRSINQVNYHAITNVKPYFSGLFGYILRYGSITIETNAAETGHTELHMVRNHEEAAHIIMKRSFLSQNLQ